MTRGRGIAGNAIWTVVGQGLQLVTLAVGVPMLVRALGHDRYAILNLAILLAGYATLLDFGIGRAAVRGMSMKLGEGKGAAAKGVHHAALVIIVLLWAAAVLALRPGLPRVALAVLETPLELRGPAWDAMRAAVLMVPTAMMAQVSAGALEAEGRFGLSQLLRIPSNILNVVLPLVGASAGWTLAEMVESLAWKNLVFWLLAIGLSQAAVPWLRGTLEPCRLPELVRPALPLAILGGFGLLSGSVDRVLIGALLPVTEVTQYGVPQQAANAAATVILAVMPVLFTAFARLETAEPAQVAALHRAAMACVLPAAAIAGAGLMACGPELLRLWVGGGFERGGLILRLLGVWLVLLAALSVTATMLQATRGMAWAVAACVAILAAQVLGTVLLVPRWHLTGAVWASLAAHAVGLVVVTAGAVRQGRWSVSRRTVVAVAAVGGLAAAGWWLGNAIRPAPAVTVCVAGIAAVAAAGMVWRFGLDRATREAVQAVYNRPTS